MPALEAHIHIADDGTLTGQVAAGTLTGDHDVTIFIAEPATTSRRINLADLPRHDELWDASISLHRNDIYGDDGR